MTNSERGSFVEIDIKKGSAGKPRNSHSASKSLKLTKEDKKRLPITHSTNIKGVKSVELKLFDEILDVKASSCTRSVKEFTTVASTKSTKKPVMPSKMNLNSNNKTPSLSSAMKSFYQITSSKTIVSSQITNRFT